MFTDEILKRVREVSEEYARIEVQLPALEAERAKRSVKSATEWNNAIVAVGTGYGCVVQGADDRFVVTAAHCLPQLPPCSIDTVDRKSWYPALLGPLGGQKTVTAACCFVDPISDVAVLGVPNSIDAPEEYEQYLQLTIAAAPLSIAVPPPASLVWIPSPEGDWLSHVAMSAASEKLVMLGLERILVEMSGVPIVLDDGTAVGVLCPDPERGFVGGVHPALVGSIPPRLLRFLGITGTLTAS